MSSASAFAIWAMADGVQFATGYPATAAGLQAAIDSFTAGKGKIFLSPGTLDCGTTSISIQQRDITIEGCGSRATTLRYSGTGDFITIGTDDGNHSGAAAAYDGVATSISLKNMRLLGPATGTGRAIVDWECGGHHFENIEIASWNYGFYGIGSDVNDWINPYIHACTVGIFAGGRSDQQRMFNPYISENGIGILAENCHGGSVFGGQFVFNTTADVVFDSPASGTEGVDTSPCEGWYFAGTWWESNTSGVARHIWVGRNGTSARICRGPIVSGGYWLASNSTCFMEVDAGAGVAISHLRHSGSASTLVVNNAVSGVFPSIHVQDDAASLPSTVTIFSGQNATMWISRGRGSTRSASFTTPYTPNGSSQELVELGALTSNLTVNAPSPAIRGFMLTFRILQDGTGGRTVTWDPVFKHSWSDAGNAAGKQSTITFYYNGTNWIQVGGQGPYV